MVIDKIVSQIMNDILGGLAGYHQNISLNRDQIADEVVDVRLGLIRELIKNNQIDKSDLMQSLNCIQIDCQSLDRCSCGIEGECEKPHAHFVLPQLITELGSDAIEFVGSTDRMVKFSVIGSLSEYRNRRYRKWGRHKPYVWIDRVPNARGLIDAYLFNAPLVTQVSVVGAFKDPRQLEQFACCDDFAEDERFSWLNQKIRETVINQKLSLYKNHEVKANDQIYRT